MKSGSNHTVHFPPASEPEKETAGSPNILGTYSATLRDVELMREKLRGLIISENRHGDLQIVLSAARRIEDLTQALIEAEEQS